MGNVFGLGILLTLEDRASNKVTGFGNSLQKLSMKAMSLNYMGKGLIQTGKALLMPVIGLSKELIRVGDDAERTRLTLTALYGSSEVAAAKFDEVIAHAAKTPFGIEELKDATTQFKTLGVELFGTESLVTSATGKTRRMIDIIGDLGAGLSGVARNGFKDVVYASREFVTEGNKLSFLRRLGIDIDAVLAKGIKADNTLKQLSLTAGETIEERKVALANLVEALNLDGLLGDLGSTWQVMVSNMGDLWYQFCLKLGDAGAFNVFKKGMKGILAIGNEFNNSEYGEQFFLNLADAFKFISKPLDGLIGLLGSLVAGFVKLGATHPIVTKLALAIPALTGVLFILAGAGLVAKASMMTFGYGLGVIAGLIPTLLLTASIIGAIAVAWKKDVGGMRTKIVDFATTVQTSFKKANEVTNMTSKDMVKSYRDLVTSWEDTGNFGDGLTAKIVSMKVLWKSFFEFWNNNKLDPETVQVLKDMGLLTTFEKIATWTVRIKDFCSGFVKGFSDMSNALLGFVRKITSVFFPSLEGGGGTGLFDALTGEFTGGSSDKIKGIGVFVAKLLPVLFIVKKAFGLIKSIRSPKGGGLGGLLGSLIGGNGSGAGGAGGAGGGGIVGAIQRLGSTLARLNPRQILKGLMNFCIIMGGLALVAIAVGSIASINPSALVLGGLAIAGLSVALIPISSPTFDTAISSLSRMARFKPKTFLKGITNLAVILGSMTLLSMAIGAIVGISPTAFVAGGLALAGMGALFMAVGNPLFVSAVSSMQGLAKIKPTTILKGLANIGIILGGMAVMMLVLGAVSLIPFDYGRVTSLVLIIGLLGVIGLALTAFGAVAGLIPVSVVALGLANMAIMIAGMSLLFMVLGAVSMIPFDYGRVSQLALILGLLGIIGLALVAFGAIAGVIPVAVVALGLANMAIMIAGMSALFLLLGAVSKVPVNRDKLVELIGLIVLIGAVGSALAVFAGIAGVIPVPIVLLGLANIALVIAGISALALVFNQLKSQSEKIMVGLEILANIGKGIGKAIGSFIGGIGEGITNSLPKIGENISQFMASISSVPTPSDGQQGIGEFLSSLASGLLKLTANDLLSIFTGGTDFAGIADGLNQLVSSKEFFNFCSSFDVTAFDNAKKFFEALSHISSLPNVGGIGQMFSGENDYSGVAEGLGKLCSDDVKKFFSTVSEMDGKAFDNAKKFWDCLDGISNLPNVGGLGQLFSGENDYSGVASGLGTLAGENVKKFFKMVGDMKNTAFDNGKKFWDCLDGISKLPNVGGIGQMFSGENDFSGVATGLGQLSGENVKKFFKMTGDLKSGAFDNAKKLFDAAKVCGEKKLKGKHFEELGEVASGLSAFFKNSKSFTEGVKGIQGLTFGVVEKMVWGVKKMKGIKNVKVDGIDSQAKSVSGFFNNAKGFIDGVKNMQGVTFGVVEKMVWGVKKMQSIKDYDVAGVWEKARSVSGFFNNAGSFLEGVKSIQGLTFGVVGKMVWAIGEIAKIADYDLSTIGSQCDLLNSFIDKVETLCTDASAIDPLGLSNVATALTGFFNTVNTLVIPSIDGLNTSISTVSTALTSLGTQISTTGTGFISLGLASSLVVTAFTSMSESITTTSTSFSTASTTVTTGMNSIVTSVLLGSSLILVALTSIKTSGQAILSSFASSGYTYGSDLVTKIASGITANAWRIKTAIQNAVATAAGSVSVRLPVSVGQNYNGTNNWVGGLTTINERGGELVDLPSGTRIYPHDKSVTMAFDEGMRTAMSQISQGGDYSSHDDSVHFHAGAIVVQANGTSDAEAERLANLIIEKIESKSRRKALATYQF